MAESDYAREYGVWRHPACDRIRLTRVTGSSPCSLRRRLVSGDRYVSLHEEQPRSGWTVSLWIHRIRTVPIKGGGGTSNLIIIVLYMYFQTNILLVRHKYPLIYQSEFNHSFAIWLSIKNTRIRMRCTCSYCRFLNFSNAWNVKQSGWTVSLWIPRIRTVTLAYI